MRFKNESVYMGPTIIYDTKMIEIELEIK